jgi:hypothetical protein
MDHSKSKQVQAPTKYNNSVTSICSKWIHQVQSISNQAIESREQIQV